MAAGLVFGLFPMTKTLPKPASMTINRTPNLIANFAL